jgi:hypothetical protein
MELGEDMCCSFHYLDPLACNSELTSNINLFTFQKDSVDRGTAHQKAFTYREQHRTEKCGCTPMPQAGF